MNTCPECDHPKGDHTALMGCLSDGGECDCGRSFPEAVKTLEGAKAEAEEAQGRAERGTSPDWADAAEAAVRHLATTTEGEGPVRSFFTSDDVWVYLEETKAPECREPRALGPILKRLQKDDVIRVKGWTESRRRHGAPIRTYEAGRALRG